MKTINSFSFLILYLFFSISLFAASQRQDLVQEGGSSWKLRKKTSGSGRRLLIGSIAPQCTYNECRGCRFKCRAEQVPVDANDPMNTSYRYLCVCHG